MIWRIHLQSFVGSNVGNVGNTSIYRNNILLKQAGNRGAQLDILSMTISLDLNDVIDCRANNVGLSLLPEDTFWNMEWVCSIDGTM